MCNVGVCVPFAVAVHAVEAVPLSVQLREGVSNLSHLSGRRVLNGVGLPLMDPCDLLAQTLKVVFDILWQETGQ